jgi:hypothetical protein
VDKALVELCESIRAEYGPVVSAEQRAEFERMLNALPPEDSILDFLEEVWRTVPQEEWDLLPHDGALNHDHYLYGTPKVSEEITEQE